MATEVSGDLSLIQDEDVLRKMWSQADDYERKKEIRLRMYKLREQRLKSYYTGDAIKAITDTPPARKHAAVTHAESISDQGFMTMKDKEIRDSESPTSDLQHRQGNEKYWTTVQDTTNSSTGDDKNFTKTYNRTSDAKAVIDDNTQVNISAREQSVHSAATEVTDNATTKREKLNLQAAISSASDTIGPNGERITSKSQQEESNTSSYSTTNSKSATGYSQRWESSSSSSSSSRRVYSSSSTTQDSAIQNRRISGDWKAITSSDDVQNVPKTKSKTTTHNLDETDFKNTDYRNSDYKTRKEFTTVEKSHSDQVNENYTTRDSVRRTSDHDNSNLTYFRSNRDVPFEENSEATNYEVNVKYNINSSSKNQQSVPEKTTTRATENLSVENVTNEVNKVDSYFTNEQSTKTSSTSVTKSSDVSTHESNQVTTPTEGTIKKGIIKHPSSLDLPKESTENQYMTTYQQSYQRINVENSPTHNAFASSLRASPDRSPVTSPTRSKSVTDRSSPDRKYRTSPTRGSPERKVRTTPTRSSPERTFTQTTRIRTTPTGSSPDKDRRVSVGSYTIESPKSPVRKISDVTPSRTSITTSSTSSTLKQKRKFSSTKTKESSKKKASTPSVSPSASPTKQLKDAPDSPVSSDNDSDASQATYSKSPINVKQTFETNTTTTTSTKSASEQVRKSSLKKTSIGGEKPTLSDRAPQSPDRTSPSRVPVVEEKIVPKKAYSECDSETDTSTVKRDILKETITPVKETPAKPEKTFVSGETCEIEFSLRKTSVTKVPEPTTQSPIFNNVRDKSPEYSSEGSVGKEIKRVRSPVKESPSSTHSSPERSAFAPIKQFRTSPEIKKTTEPSYPAEKFRKPSNAEAPAPEMPSSRKSSLKTFSAPKTSSPTRSVSSSASPASSPERRSPHNKSKKVDLLDAETEETEVVKTAQETRVSRQTSVSRSDSKSALTKKKSEKSIKDRVTQGTKIPSSTELRSSSVNRKTNRTVESVTVTKKPTPKATDVSKTPQRGSSSSLKTVRTTLTATVNDRVTPKSGPVARKPATPTQITKPKTSSVRGTNTPSTTSSRVTSKIEVNVSVSPLRKPASKKETTSSRVKSYEAPKRPESPLRKPTTLAKETKTNSLRALQLICSQETTSKTQNEDSFEYEIDIDETNLEDELPPDDFTLDVTDRAQNIQTTNKTIVSKTVTTQKTAPKKPTVQTLKSENKYTRSSNDKLISRLATPKRQPSKPEVSTPKGSRVPVNRLTPAKTPTPKKAPLIKKGSTGSTTTTKKTILKKSSKDSIKPADDSSSSSEDELNDVSITVDTTERDQKYVEELEEIRRREESEHSSKLFATSNKDSSLLSVIVQLPSSSRESSPDYANRSQYSAAVSDDGSEKPVRYADRVSEPEDSDVNQKVKSSKFLRAEGRIYEQVTDLDEESESESSKIDVSVADRVSKFLKSTKTSNTTATSNFESQPTKDKSVLKAAAIFDKIVENQYAPVGPSNKVIDIYSKQFPSHEMVNVEDRSEQYLEMLESELKIDDRRRSSVISEDIASPVKSNDRRRSSINQDDVKSSIKAYEKRRSSVNVEDIVSVTKTPDRKRSSIKQDDVAVSPKSYDRRRSSVHPEDVAPVTKVYDRRRSSIHPEDVAPVTKVYDRRRSSVHPEDVEPVTKVYDRRRSSNSEDIIMENKSIDRKLSIKSDVLKTNEVITEEVITVDVTENKKSAPFERKDSSYSSDYKSRKDFFEKKATTPVSSVPSSPRAAPKFATSIKPHAAEKTPETKPSSLVTRRDSEARKSPEKDFVTSRKPSLKVSPVDTQKAPSSRKSPEKEVPSTRRDSLPQKDVPSTRRDSLPQKDVPSTRRDSILQKEAPSTRKESLTRRISEKDLAPTPTESTPTSPVEKPHESTLFKPTLASSRRTSTPRKSPERQTPLEKQPSSNELPRNVRKSPEKNVVKTAKSIWERRSIFEQGATEKKAPVKQTPDFRGFGKTGKTNISSTFIENERKVVETEKKVNENEGKPIERKTSRAEITLVKTPTRRDSSTIRTSPERRPSASQPVDQQPRTRPESPKKSPSVSEFERKSSFTSTTQKTSQKTVQVDTNETKSPGKFSRTPSQSGPTTSAPTVNSTPKRSTSVNESGTEIEEIFDVELLEKMMESATAYDIRRRIRAQIRIAKRKPDTTTKSTSSTYETTTVTSTKTKPTPRGSITEKVEFVTSTPIPQESKSQFSSEYKTEFSSRSSTVSAPSKPVEAEPFKPKEVTPAEETPKKTVESKKEIVLERRPSGAAPTLHKTESFIRRGSKTADGVYEFTVTTKNLSQKSHTTSETKEVSGTDSITSSYGVGPTDENGLPLFGLKALRRSNTSKALLLTDEVSSALNTATATTTTTTTETDSSFRDSGGRPLFGGLKALQRSTPASDDMPEQPASPQLKDLVSRHEKHVRESTTIESLPRQKPKARLRDSFVLQSQDEEELVRSIANAGVEEKRTSEEATSSQKSVSLRSIMKKHDTGNDSGATVHMETKRSVISSHGTVNPDGTVSVTRNVVQGKISSKNGEEPTGQITSTHYNYQAPSIHEKGREETTTQTTLLGGRRISTGPQITEAIEDDYEGRRSSSAKKYVSSRSSSGTKITEILENGDSSSRRSSGYDDAPDGKLNGILKKSSSGKFSTASSSYVTTSTAETVTNGTVEGDTSRKSSLDTDRRKPSLVRGDSIKALQHKFQQATVSSSLKQNSAASLKSRSSSNSLDSATKTISTSSSTKTSQPSETNQATVKTSSSYSVKSKTESTSSGPTSFLDNKSRVTGVQDILERMRNADLAETEESTEDQEARSLLNKFLGASVILQGMEAGMKSINGRASQSLTTNSATLVNRVEKQRVASEVKTQSLDEVDLEKIWDEQHLNNLLEACTDYEGRRKIRARLRTVMAEHKACGDVTALMSNSAGGDAAMTQDCSESSSVSTKTEGNTTTRTEVHTHTTTSTARLTKSGSIASSPFAKFRQLERQHSAPSSGSARAPIYKITDPKLMNSAATIKERLLSWVKAQTKEYKNIQIENFSSSWSNGLAFCALIHHFLPNAFDYDKLTPEERRYNFELAFRVAEEEAGIAPLLDVEDMVIMRRPDWKCVFTYVQSIYRCFHKSNRAVLVFNF